MRAGGGFEVKDEKNRKRQALKLVKKMEEEKEKLKSIQEE
jgi:hypothetical protein